MMIGIMMMIGMMIVPMTCTNNNKEYEDEGI